MAVTYNANTATITASYAGANPTLGFMTVNGVDRAGVYLNVHPDILTTRVTDPYQLAAIVIDASITVDAPSVADIQNAYQFHLMQLISQPKFYVRYAGKTENEGSLTIDYSSPPAMPAGQPLLSDAVADNAFPFYEKRRAIMPIATQVGKKWRVDVETCDHPFAAIPRKVKNYAANGATNYLYEVRRNLSLYTALVVEELATGDLDPIGYIGWNIKFWAKIGWTFANGGETPVAASYLEQSFTVDSYMPNTPNRQADHLMTHPPTAIADTYNGAMSQIQQSIKQTVEQGHRNTTYCKAAAKWADSEPSKQFSF